MKQYPKIPTRLDGGSVAGVISKFWVFDKIDGSNIRVEWSNKRGFYKFGTRKRLLGQDDEIFGKVPAMVAKIEPEFSKRFKELNIDRAICFFEFWGEKSFAGWHDVNDPTHKISLIDIAVERKGMMDPDEFCDFLRGTTIESAKLLHCGKLTEDIRQKVRKGTLPGMSFEGVVCKARKPRKWSEPIMYKIKNEAWIEKVKATRDRSQWEEIL